MKIVNLVAKNFKRIKAVEITPDGDLVIVGGKNAQGKSSVLDSILAALAGKRKLPKKALHEGQERGYIELNLGEYKVRRTFTKDGGGTLKITNADGATFGSPQKMLDKIVGEISFDPFEFARMEPKKQVEILKSVTGLDFSDIEKKRAFLYEERTEVNREGKRLDAQCQKLEEKLPDEMPEKKVSVKNLMEKLNKANEENSKVDKLEIDVENTTNQVEYVKEELKELKRQFEAKKEEYKKLTEKKSKLEEKKKKSKRVDTTKIKETLNAAEETNKAVDLVNEHKQLLKDVREHKDKYRKLTDAIKEIDAEKAQRLAEVDMPLEGLSFTEDGIFINGIPFEQESSSKQLKLSISIGMSLNPELKVLLVKDGGLLDSDSLKEVEKAVKENGYQLWLEKVGEGDEVGVIIEDGGIKS